MVRRTSSAAITDCRAMRMTRCASLTRLSSSRLLSCIVRCASLDNVLRRFVRLAVLWNKQYVAFKAADKGSRRAPEHRCRDRKSGVKGTSVSVRVDTGGRRIIKKKTNTYYNHAAYIESNEYQIL